MNNQFGRAEAFRSALLVSRSIYFSYAVGLVASMLIARKLGPRDFGHYAYFVWLSGSLTLLFCNGLTLSAIRFVSESLGRGDAAEASNVHKLLGGWFRKSLFVVSALFLVTYPWLKPMGWDRPTWIFAAAAIGAAIAKSRHTFGASISKGFGLFEVEARTINLLSFINLVGVGVLAFLNVQIDAYILFFIALSVGHTLVTQALMRRAGIASGHDNVPERLRARIASHYLWTTALFLVFAFSNKSVENLFLNSYVGPEAVGWFAIAAAMTRGGIDMLSSGLNAVLMPMMSHAVGSGDARRTKRIFIDAVRYYFFLGIVLAGIGVIWADPAISVLFGAEYAPAILALQVMMVVGALTMPDGAIYSMLMTTDNQPVRVSLAVTLVLITLAIAAALVPTYGFKGALAAHAIARLTILVACFALVSRVLKIKLPFGELLRIAGVALIGVALVAPILITTSGIIWQLVAGAVYVFGCIFGSVLLRLWTTADVRMLSPLGERFPCLRRFQRWIEQRARGTLSE